MYATAMNSVWSCESAKLEDSAANVDFTMRPMRFDLQLTTFTGTRFCTTSSEVNMLIKPDWEPPRGIFAKLASVKDKTHNCLGQLP